MKERVVSSCYDPLTLIRLESSEVAREDRLDVALALGRREGRSVSHVRALAWLCVATVVVVLIAAGLRSLP